MAVHRGDSRKRARTSALFGAPAFLGWALFKPWPYGFMTFLLYPLLVYVLMLLVGWLDRVLIYSNGLQLGRKFVSWNDVRSATLVQEGEFSRIALFVGLNHVSLPPGLQHREDFSRDVKSVAPPGHPLLKYLSHQQDLPE